MRTNHDDSRLAAMGVVAVWLEAFIKKDVLEYLKVVLIQNNICTDCTENIAM